MKLPCSLKVHHSLNMPMCSSTWKLSKPHPFQFCGGTSLQSILIKPLAIDLSSTRLPSLEVGVGVGGGECNWPPSLGYLGDFPKSPR